MLQDAVIDGLVKNLVVNGVEVGSYVEAELDRRHPVRLLIRSADPADLRHLVFVHDSWFRRCCLNSARPFTALGLATPFVPDQQEQGLDQAADPSLDDVLTVRDDQAAELAEWLATVTAAGLSAAAPVPAGPGWPPYAAGRSVLQCLRVVPNGEREHHGFCVRDLDLLQE